MRVSPVLNYVKSEPTNNACDFERCDSFEPQIFRSRIIYLRITEADFRGKN